MKETQINAAIALSTVAAAVVMLGALSFAIGKWSFDQHVHELIIKFPNASGINANSEVKFAGAPSGRVKLVRLIKRQDQTVDPGTSQFNCVEVVAEVDAQLEIGDDVEATIKQDGLGISAKYILLSPGPDHNSKDLADGAVIQGKEPFDLTDLLQPAGDALQQAKMLVTKLGPAVDRLSIISEQLQSKLPPLMDHADRLMRDGDGVLANLNTSTSKERINDTLANLRVSTENLKVVSSNAKALTATLAQKPWRVFWGGTTVPAPSETQVIRSDDVIPLKPDVDVNSSTPIPPATSSTDKKKSP